jgi:hypothetical protein
MVRKRALERWAKSWQTAKSHLKLHGLLRNPSRKGVDQRHHLQFMVPEATCTYYPIDKANAIADCLKNQFTALNLCDCAQRQRVEDTVQTLLATVGDGAPVKFWPCDVSKETRCFKSGKSCYLDDILNKCLRHLPRRPLVHLTHLFSHFPGPWKESIIINLIQFGKEPNFPQNLRPISLLSTTGKTMWEADFKNNPKTYCIDRRTLLSEMHVDLLRVWLHNWIMRDAGRSNPERSKSNSTWYWTRRSHS